MTWDDGFYEYRSHVFFTYLNCLLSCEYYCPQTSAEVSQARPHCRRNCCAPERQSRESVRSTTYTHGLHFRRRLSSLIVVYRRISMVEAQPRQTPREPACTASLRQ